MEKTIDNADKELFLDNDFASLWYFPKEKIISHKFKRFARGDDFRNVLLTGAEKFEQNDCTKWLSDDQQIGMLNKDDTDWGEKNWTPRVIKAGWKKWAHVMPQRAAGKLRTKEVIKHFKSFGIEVRTFENPDDAYRWLAESE